MSQSTISPGQEDERERRLQLLLARLPVKIQNYVARLRRPEAKWTRLPAGGLFILGGFLWFLPVLGIWMLPLGLLLLSDDAPLLRRASGVILEWIERKHPKWMGLKD